MTIISKIILVILIFLFLFSLSFFQKHIKNFFYSISLPIEKFLWKTGREIELIFGAKKLKTENKDLKLKNQELLKNIIDFQAFKEENEILRKALKVGLEKEFELIFADIIGKDIFQDYILVDKGSEDGISANLSVITAEKVLVGRIDEVYKNFSRVILISNSQITIPAKILNKETKVLVEGKGNGQIFIDFIPLDFEVSKGDVVFTSAKKTLPKKLLIGVLKEIKKEDIKSFQRAQITPFFNISKTDKVFIIKNF